VTESSSAALALHARAKELANAGDLPGAEELLRKALPVAKDPVLALVDGTLAFVEAEQGRLEEGLERCRQALTRPGLTQHSRALLTGQLGIIRWLSGHTKDAIGLFTEALEELDGEHRVQVLLNRGTARLLIGELAAARQDFFDGMHGGEPVAAAKCAHNLGYLHLLRGELVAAIRRMDGARPDLEALGPGVTGPIDIDRAQALEEAGLDREAIGLLRDVHRRLASTGLWRIQADVEVRLARLLSGPEAIALAETAVDRYVRHGNEVEADGARAVALDLRAQTPEPPPADELETVASRLSAAGRAAAARALRVRAAGLRGEMPEPVDDTAPISVQLLAGEIGARVALARGEPEEALRRAGAALDVLEDWQRTIGSLELQITTRARGNQVLRLGQRAALSRSDAVALLEWSERARELAARGTSARPPEELGDLLGALRLVGPDGDPDERARLIEAVRHGRWHAPGSVRPHGTLTLDCLQEALGRARFVSLLHVDGDIVALAVGADDVRVHRLGQWSELARWVGGLRADLAVAVAYDVPVVQASLRERLAAIDALLRPAWEGAETLVLTVDDALYRVPWGQLKSLRGVGVVLPTSATAWVRATDRDAGRLATATVVVGPGTSTGCAEAEAIRRLWPSTTEIHLDAGCARVAELAGSTDLLHVCAHGHDRDAHRLLASIDLADGPWFGHDVELLPRVPEIVVLSVCGVGGGSLGMARAWIHAGARHVIAAPTNIAEKAASERFPELYTRLAAGESPAGAVAAAFGPDALDCAVQCYGPG
jgi:tetratricopeptide (TPR) repeat protein